MFDRLIFSSGKRGEMHRIFKNDAGEVSLCDWSGDVPESTDDGPLIVDPGSVVTISAYKNKPVAIVPVRCPRVDMPSSVWCDPLVAKRLNEHVALKFRTTAEFRDVVRGVLMCVSLTLND